MEAGGPPGGAQQEASVSCGTFFKAVVLATVRRAGVERPCGAVIGARHGVGGGDSGRGVEGEARVG